MSTPQLVNVALNEGEGVWISLPHLGPAFPELNIPVVLAGQQSVVRSIRVKFDQPVSVEPEAFTVVPRLGVIVQGPVQPSQDAVIITAAPQPGGENKVWILKFAGPGVHLPSGVIKQGVYDVTVDPSKVTASGTPMAAPASFTFWAMFGGAAAATTTVTFAMDSQNLDGHFGASLRSSPANYSAAHDATLDGTNDGVDLSLAQSMQGAVWTF